MGRSRRCGGRTLVSGGPGGELPRRPIEASTRSPPPSESAGVGGRRTPRSQPSRSRRRRTNTRRPEPTSRRSSPVFVDPLIVITANSFIDGVERRPLPGSHRRHGSSRPYRLAVITITPRLELFGTALVGDRVKRPDSDLRVERDVNVPNVTGIRVLVPKPNVTPTMRLWNVPEIGQYGDDLSAQKRSPSHLPQEVGKLLLVGLWGDVDPP